MCHKSEILDCQVLLQLEIEDIYWIGMKIIRTVEIFSILVILVLLPRHMLSSLPEHLQC